LEPCLEISEPKLIHLDLRGLVFLAAAPLAVLVAVMMDLDHRGLVAIGSVYRPPRNRLVERYLARMDFERLLVDPATPENFSRRKEEGFRPCRVFAAHTELPLVVHSLVSAVAEACQLTTPAQKVIYLALNEIAQNVVDHSSAGAGGVCIAQRLRSRHEFEVAIVDCGIGVRASLTGNPAYSGVDTDAEAIATAIRPGVTGLPISGRGLGLHVTRQLLAANHGTLTIRSGDATVEAGSRTVITTDGRKLPGTLVVLRAPTNRQLHLPDALALSSER
jgi:anti-sigma regulatory factor (Ser/Thr protein kinase)